MKCDKCGGKMLTNETRQIDLGIWRHRTCDTCDRVMTTLEQECETIKAPFLVKKDRKQAQGVIVAPPVPVVRKPTPRKTKRAIAQRKPEPKPLPKVAPAPKPKPDEVRVDRNEPTARDRIEDMKADREQGDHGWDD